ncbi:hypothetical protein TUM4438_44020 [Shewanella sairae]|uniref:HTH luxR-type domain-containing protein n=1 Tax=Shewanella sairae TaxID=190310 RepID=A0ABQ4PRK0_9GAMM|nr:helix-turn-helix transcriptional regulator [Shewanella sairae]MCL1132498.1 hypothetical protein [Shewanella sairae]GIU52126.1 hypothetical protein TUM4438_44020 [Shewanella sairae]
MAHPKSNEANIKEIFPNLTPKQLSILIEFSLGRTPSQLKELENCSRTSIEKHLSNLRHNFGCSSTGELRTVFLNNILMEILINLKNK